MTGARAKKDIEAALQDKGFEQRSGDHRYYIYHSLAGKKTLVKTKTSHGGHPKTIGGDLLHDMAKQCRLTKDEFLRLVDCPLSRRDYESLLQRQRLL